MGKRIQIRVKGDLSKYCEIGFNNNGELMCLGMRDMEILVDGEVIGYLEDFSRDKPLLAIESHELKQAHSDLDVLVAAINDASVSRDVLSDLIVKLGRDA